MQMELAGIREAEKEYTFTTPVALGLSYKRLNRNHPDVHNKIGKCIKFIADSIRRSNNQPYIKPEFLFNKFLQGYSDMWVAVEGQEITGCLMIGVANYPEQTGIIFRSYCW